jgi:hypothetical protein
MGEGSTERAVAPHTLAQEAWAFSHPVRSNSAVLVRSLHHGLPRLAEFLFRNKRCSESTADR